MTDQELMQWAQSHPDDPRAAKVVAHFKGAAAESQLDQHGNPMQRLDRVSSEAGTKAIGKAAGVGLPVAGQVAGTMTGIPGAGAAGAGLGNMAGGAVERALGTSSEGGPVSDFAWGAGPVAALRATGGALRSYGKPALAKAVGYLLGKPTQEAAAEAGPSLSRVTSPHLEQILGADTPGGAQMVAGNIADQTGKQIPQALNGGGSMTSRMPYPGTSTAPGISPSVGTATTPLSMRPNPVMLGNLADETSQLQSFAAPQGKLSGLLQSFLGKAPGGEMLSRSIGSSDPSAARYVSALTQAVQRGLPLTPELESLLSNAPLQRAAAPVAVQSAREAVER